MKNGRLLLPVLLFSAFGCVAFAIYFLTASPANASLLATSIPTQENLWARADVAKPTYTATTISLPTETSTPMPTFTETPASFTMEIVSDAPAAAAQVPASQPPLSYAGSKYILVDISEQHM